MRLVNVAAILLLVVTSVDAAPAPPRGSESTTKARTNRSTSKKKTNQSSQNAPEVEVVNVEYGRELEQTIQVGVRVTAGGPCRGIVVSLPVPKEWPEQRVRIVDEDISQNVSKVSYRVLEDAVKQMVLVIPRLDAGEESHALVTFEVKGRAVSGPISDTSKLSAPKKSKKEIRKFLAASPLIESRNRKIQTETKKLIKEIDSDWKKAEAIYDFVREKVAYQESKLKGAVQSLNEGVADCEGMTSLFIAMCRAAKIPARVVWVTDHCYPEFYLEDENKNGQWYPCQVAGSHAFGSMPDIRPILQKGDNIRVPEKRGGQRYANLFLKAKAVKKPNPKVEEVMEFVYSE